MATIQPITGIAPSRLNPWVSIWTQPRATMRAILDTDPRKHVLLLVILGGLVTVLDRPSPGSGGDELLLPDGLLPGAIIGPLLALLAWGVGSWLVRWTGSLLGGEASLVETRAAVAWAHVPWIVGALLLWLLSLGLAAAGLFPAEGSGLSLVLLPVGIIELVILGWAFVISLKCLGEAHGFSAWKALGAELIAGVLMVAGALVFACGFVALLGVFL